MSKSLTTYCSYLVGAIYKILPLMEEDNSDWVKYTKSLILEIKGFLTAVEDELYLLRLMSKLEGLLSLQDTDLKNLEVHSFFKKNIFDAIELAKKAGGADE